MLIISTSVDRITSFLVYINFSFCMTRQRSGNVEGQMGYDFLANSEKFPNLGHPVLWNQQQTVVLFAVAI